MSNDLKDLRRSGVVSTFGPGAIVDFRSENAPVSGVTAGLDEWDRSFKPAGLANDQKVFEERLQKKLGVHGFRLPPVIDEQKKDPPDKRRLVAARFPNWLQCPDCDYIKPERGWAADPGHAYRYCAACTQKAASGKKTFVIPVRFVFACKRGHLDEFPWDFWVQHKDGCKNRNRGLLLRSEGPGLAGLILSCPKCEQSRSMDGIFSKKTWEKLLKCSGRRPWLAGGDESCEQPPIAVQRGASNLYFPLTQSALSIPPWSDRLQESLGTWWGTIVSVLPEDRAAFVKMSAAGPLAPVLQDLGMTPDELVIAIDRRLARYEEIETDDLRPAEFKQFVEDPGNLKDEDLEFEIRREPVPPSLRTFFSTLVRAVRLREVRALTGFTRILPPGDPDSPEVAQLSLEKKNWLPAIEVRGEGIFLALNEKTLQTWEKRPAVIDRAHRCNEKYRADWHERYGDDAEPTFEITARYMLCHTLSHAVMRQLTLECGYSSASLQERIYAASGAPGMAGVLIYTATPDADGTLGGLQRQGLATRMEGIITRAVAAIEWCSSDPLCITDMMGALAAYSHSSCHACVLAPETSCEAFNNYLDRGLLTGVPGDPEVGFFSSLLQGAA